MRKRYVFFVVLAVILAALSLAVFADTVPTVAAVPSLTSVVKGNSFTLNIKASSFDTVASVDFNIYYDSTVFSAGTVTNGGMISGDAFVSANTDEAGVIKVSAVDMDGFTASGTLLSVRMTALASTDSSRSPLRISVGDSYGVDLNGISVQGVSSAVTVTEPAASQKTFSLYSMLSGSPASKGDTVSVRLANSNRYGFGSADFTVKYDSDVFEVDSVVLESDLLKEKATYSINTDVKGTVLISYANPDAVSAYYLCKVNFKVVADRNGSTSITSEAKNVYADDLSPYLPYTATSTVTLKKLPETVDLPDMWLDTDEMIVGRTVKSILKLELGAGVAAGDFKLSYDTEVLKCVNVSVCDGLAEKGGTIIVDEGFEDGTVEFPYVNSEGYSDTELDLVCIEWIPLKSPETHFTVTLEGAMVYDSKYNPLSLEYVTETGCIYSPSLVLPTAESDAYIKYGCTCQKGYNADVEDETGLSVLYSESVGAYALIPTSAGGGLITGAELETLSNNSLCKLVSEDDTAGTGDSVDIAGCVIPAVVKGDVDGDGMVTVFDAAMIKEAVENDGFAVESLRETAGDADSSGVTDDGDSRAVLLHLLEKTNIGG